MSGGSVLGLFAGVRREDCLRALSLCLLRIRSNGYSYKQIAARLDCSADTVENACNEKSLLGFDCIVRIATEFPDQWEMVEALWKFAPPPRRSIADKLRALLNDIESGRPL